MWLKNINAPRSSSMGRLFDAVASLGGFVQSLDYEGQGGMMMESFVEDSITEPFAFEVNDGMIDLSPMVREIISLEGDKTEIASRFIATVEAIMSYYATRYPELPIVIGGGVFQNRALMGRLYRRFGEGDFMPNSKHRSMTARLRSVSFIMRYIIWKKEDLEYQ
jgi:hydrogenase maturation protein HypF